MRGPLVELVVVVDAGARGSIPSAPAREPQPQREVDVLVVEEESLGKPPSRVEVARGIARQAPERKPGLARPPAPPADRLVGAAGPGDAGEVDDAAAGVDPRPAVGGHERLPGRPAAASSQRRRDRLAQARPRRPRRG